MRLISEDRMKNLLEFNPYKDIPKLPDTKLHEASNLAGITEVQDFDPEGDSKGKSHKWPFMSKAVLIRDNYSCRICGKSDLSTFSTADQYGRVHLAVQVHHIIPRKDDGKNTFRNLITLCEECHRKTFSNDYAGLPVSGQTTIYRFESKIKLCTRKEWADAISRETSRGTLKDHALAFDNGSGRYRVFPRIGENLDLYVVELGSAEYRKICDLAVGEADASDYITLQASTEKGRDNIRFFVTRGGELII